MKFKVSFARVVSEAQLVEALIEADSLEEAHLKYSTGDFKRFLIQKRDLRDVTKAGEPRFEQVN